MPNLPYFQSQGQQFGHWFSNLDTARSVAKVGLATACLKEGQLFKMA